MEENRVQEWILTVEKDEDGWYVVECPAIPGCVYQETLNIALLWSADAVSNRVLLTSHSSGVKPIYEETLIQSLS